MLTYPIQYGLGAGGSSPHHLEDDMKIQMRSKELANQQYLDLGSGLHVGAIKRREGGYRLSAWLADGQGGECSLLSYEVTTPDVAKALLEAGERARDNLRQRAEVIPQRAA
jgi:hypothetical protein